MRRRAALFSLGSHLDRPTTPTTMDDDQDQSPTLEDLANALNGDEGQAQDAPGSTEGADDSQAEGATEAESDLEGEQEAAADDEGQATQAPADDAVISWTTAGGEALEAPLSELKAGYLRQSDYTQKTQALAEERKQASEQVAKQYQQVQEFAREQAQLMNMQEQLALFAKADWNALYEQDPTEAGRLQAQWRQLEARAQDTARSFQAKVQQREAEQATQFQQRTQEALQTMQRDIPGFGAEHLKAMQETGIAHGFTDAELSQVADARTLKVLHEAAQWRALQAKKPETKQKVQAAPPKASKPGAASVPQSKREAAWKQLNARRDVDSLAALIAASE